MRTWASRMDVSVPTLMRMEKLLSEVDRGAGEGPQKHAPMAASNCQLDAPRLAASCSIERVISTSIHALAAPTLTGRGNLPGLDQLVHRGAAHADALLHGG